MTRADRHIALDPSAGDISTIMIAAIRNRIILPTEIIYSDLCTVHIDYLAVAIIYIADCPYRDPI
jgi:hypothetical protein